MDAANNAAPASGQTKPAAPAVAVTAVVPSATIGTCKAIASTSGTQNPSCKLVLQNTSAI